MEHVFTLERKTGALNQGDCRRVVYSTMNWSGIFDKISQTYFGTSPPAELSLAIGLKKCWSYVAFLQAMENFTLSLNASISDLYFGITLMHYYWVKSFTLVLLTWVMITEFFATVHLALSSSIYYTFKTQWHFLCPLHHTKSPIRKGSSTPSATASEMMLFNWYIILILFIIIVNITLYFLSLLLIYTHNKIYSKRLSTLTITNSCKYFFFQVTEC